MRSRTTISPRRASRTGVTDGYLHDYASTPQGDLGDRAGLLYQGQVYAWQRNVRGTPTRGLAPSRFVHYLENHDQIANAGFGERLAVLLIALHRAMTTLLLTRAVDPDVVQGQRPARQAVAVLRRSRSGTMRGGAPRSRALRQPIRAARDARGSGEHSRSQRARDVRRVRSSSSPGAGAARRSTEVLHRDLIAAARRSDVHDRAPRWRRAVLTRCACAGPSAVARQPRANVSRAITAYENRGSPLRESGWRVAWSSEDPRYGGHGTPRPFTVARLANPSAPRRAVRAGSVGVAARRSEDPIPAKKCLRSIHDGAAAIPYVACRRRRPQA